MKTIRTLTEYEILNVHGGFFLVSDFIQGFKWGARGAAISLGVIMGFSLVYTLPSIVVSLIRGRNSLPQNEHSVGHGPKKVDL